MYKVMFEVAECLKYQNKSFLHFCDMSGKGMQTCTLRSEGISISIHQSVNKCQTQHLFSRVDQITQNPKLQRLKQCMIMAQEESLLS